MVNNTKNSNPAIISISSSSDDDNQQDDFQSESEFESASDDDYDDDCDESESDGQEVDDDDDGMHSGDLKFDSGDCHDDERLCNRVVRLLKERRKLQVLNLGECKSYLRRHGLRLSGTKAECIERINEHWRIKDGSGEALYPRPSFSINCTGVMSAKGISCYSHRKYLRNLKGGEDPWEREQLLVGSSRKVMGQPSNNIRLRLKYCGARDSKHCLHFFPLLVKGRNLYKLKTFRQRWKSEGERPKMLDEKHRRGAAARHTRAIRKTKHVQGIYTGEKRRKQFLSTPSHKKQTAKGDRRKCARRPGTSQVETLKSNNHPRYPYPVNLTGLSRTRIPVYGSDCHFSHNSFPREYQNQTSFQGFTSSGPDATSSTSRFSLLRPDLNSYRNLSSEGLNHRSHLHHTFSHPNYNPVTRNSSQYPRPMNTSQLMHPYYPKADEYEHWKYGY